MYYKDAEGAIVVFDLGDIETFDRAKNWVKELKEFMSGHIPIIIAGNKADLQKRVVEEEKISALADSVNGKYFYTSAKTGEAVNDLFKELAEQVAAKRESVPRSGGFTLLSKSPAKKADNCC